jgi:predicted nucleic acid-binding protein
MIYLDANIFLYAVLDDGEKRDSCQKILNDVGKGKISACTSPLTWDEIVHTLKKHAPLEEVLDQSRQFRKFPNLIFFGVTSSVLEKAEQLMEVYGLKPRDAIHAATAIVNNVNEIASDNSDFDKVKELKRKKI